MSAIHPRSSAGEPADHQAARWEADVRGPAYFSQVLACVAGTYASESEARDTATRLAQQGALPPGCMSVLAPADGGALRFTRLSRAWARQPHSAGQSWVNDPWLMLMLGTPAAVLAAGSYLAIGDSFVNDSAVLLIMFGALFVAVTCAALALLGRRQPQYVRFDQAVRRQLTAGHWVIVAHDLPPLRQDRIVALLREHSVNWCAVSPAPLWL